MPEMQQVTLKVLRWEERDKHPVIKEAQLVSYPRDAIQKGAWPDCDEWLLSQWTEAPNKLQEAPQASLLLGWYRRSPWTDEQLAQNLRSMEPRFRPVLDAKVLLKDLGEAGAKIIEDWKNAPKPRPPSSGKNKPKSKPVVRS